MYTIGQGQQQMGPGTGLVQRINWTGNPNPPLGLAGCECGGKCKQGMGLFDSMDFTTWGPFEWGSLGLGAYALLSMVSTTQRGYRATRKRVGRALKRHVRSQE